MRLRLVEGKLYVLGEGDEFCERWDPTTVDVVNERIAKLEETLREVCDDLESELRGIHQIDAGSVHPATKHRFDRDMAVVRAARDVLDG